MGSEEEAFPVGNGIRQSVHPSFWEREDQRDPEGVSEGNKGLYVKEQAKRPLLHKRMILRAVSITAL